MFSIIYSENIPVPAGAIGPVRELIKRCVTLPNISFSTQSTKAELYCTRDWTRGWYQVDSGNYVALINFVFMNIELQWFLSFISVYRSTLKHKVETLLKRKRKIWSVLSCNTDLNKKVKTNKEIVQKDPVVSPISRHRKYLCIDFLW